MQNEAQAETSSKKSQMTYDNSNTLTDSAPLV